MKLQYSCITCIVCLSLSLSAVSEWPNWRGPDGTGGEKRGHVLDIDTKAVKWTTGRSWLF
ncbi:MAG: hypothetical protein O3C43_19265 [Verrucomicrobia bacterium]|nr:hypothetical protein [Verrucomicrobiota bacterium]